MCKKIELEVYSCAECPYCQHNGDYGMSYDSGYDCCKDGSKRICDDNEIYKYDKAFYKVMHSQNTLFPEKYESIKEKDPFEIPDWCPLTTSNIGEDQ